jgi:uncharacterized protein YcbK (DUF882 family)
MVMRTRSFVQLLLGAVCVVALPAPFLLATTSEGAALLRDLVPGVPLSLASTAPTPARAPSRLRLVAGPPLPEDVLPPAPLAAGVEITPLPSREIAVKVENVNSGETATFEIGVGGRTRADQAAAIEHFFRCRRTGRHRPLADSVLALLADVAQRWPGRVIEVVSGYRSPPFGTRHSRHFAGHAIDLRVRGVRTARVRDFVWRDHHEVGVGHYAAQNFLHIDSRPGQPDTAWSAAREDSPPQYDPRWAKRARRTKPVGGPLASLSSTTR